MNTVEQRPATGSLAQRILAEQVRLLYAQAPLDTTASFLIAPMLVLIYWDVVPHAILLIWLALLETTILIRMVLIAAFRRASNLDADASHWARRYTWACAISGTCWGGCLILLILFPSLVYQSLTALVLGGVLMGSAPTMASVLITYVAYVLPLILPSVLWLLLQDDPLRITMGTTGILYLLLALGTAQRYHQTLTRSLRLALDNAELAQSFATAKEQTEEINQQLAEQQAALRGSVEAMRELYEVISIPRRHPSEQIQAMLAMGCQRFGLAIGILSHIEGERYEIVQASTTDGAFAQGDVFALGDTFCRDTMRIREPLGFEQASTGRQQWHPCYLKFKLEAYLGTPVHVGDQIYGTLNFSDFQPRTIPFAPVDRELIQLMARWVGSALEQERMVAAARRQQTLLAHVSRLNTLGEMASRLAHEVNQPITAISLYAENGLGHLRNISLDPTVLQEILEKIAAQSTRTHTIIQQIRRFARQGKPQYLKVRINTLLDDITDFLDMEVRHHQIHFRQEIATDLPPVLADPLQVQQVILNLIRNAVDATSTIDGPRTIVLSAHAEPGKVELAIRDNGSGLDPSLLRQLPHPFFTTKPDGLGLGLSISQSIVEAHGGRLWATPNQDTGVTFHFTLPAVRIHRPEQAELALIR